MNQVTKAIDSPEPVQALWIGDSLGPIEQLAIASFLRAGHPYHLYAYNPLKNVPPGTTLRDAREVLPESEIFAYQVGEAKGSFAAFSNLFRYKLLLDRGGWWVDTDVVCRKQWKFREPVVFATEDTRKGMIILASCVIKLPAGHAVARKCYERALTVDRATVQWGVIGPRLLQAVVLEERLLERAKAPEVFCPIPWWQWRSLLAPNAGPAMQLLKPETYGMHFWHEAWRRHGIDRNAQFPESSAFVQLLKFYGLSQGEQRVAGGQ